MSPVSPSAGLVAAALVAAAVAVPVTVSAGTASAACLAGVQFNVTNHKRVYIPVPNAKITFTKAGKHTVEIVKASTLSAKYGTGDVDDQDAILAAVKEDWPKVRDSVAVTKGHKKTFSSSKGERVTVSYESNGDRVKWEKLDVEGDCSTKVLASGIAKFPRKNLDWVFATSIS